jgi:hypothetical protein
MRWACKAAWLAVVLAAALARRAAAAAEPSLEGSHGRIAGDVTLVVGAGAVAAPRGARAEGELRVRYLESAGVFATYEDGALIGSGAEPRRVLAAGVELRPLFLFRWLRDHETRRARFDLALDSLGVELGATFLQPSGAAFAARPGVQVGVGVELPVLERATGPWVGLHGGLRWSDDALGSGVVTGADDREAYLALTLAWHQVVMMHVVDAGDEAPR